MHKLCREDHFSRRVIGQGHTSRLTTGIDLHPERVHLWLLDHTLMLYGSGMSNSNIHNHSPLPVFVAGGAVGRMKGGRHLKFPENTPMANLLLTILEKAGVHQENVGDSTGPLSEV